MKKRWSVVASALLLASLVVAVDQPVQVSATAITSDSVSQGTPVGTAGYLGYYDNNITILGSNGEPYQNGNSNTPFQLTISSTNGLNVNAHTKSIFEYAPEQVAMSVDNNGGGYLWHVDEVANNNQPVTGSNGYLMISNTSLPSWIQALHGNPVYVKDAEDSTSTATGDSFNAVFQDPNNYEDFNLYDFPAVVADSGDEIVAGGSPTGPINVVVTPNPTATLTVSHASATIGTDETLTAKGKVSAYDTAYHYAGVSIVNTTTGITVPQSDITFALNDGSTSLTPPSSNTPMVEMNTGYGSYTDTMNVNTSQLGAGNYEATYYVSDYRDRFAPSRTVSFVLNSATTPTAGTLTLTASPTSTTVGTAVTLSASYTGAMPPNSAIYLHDLSN
ncbi:MAG: hypothetical protein OWR52_14280, partial [Acidibacillus sp.]|nr:hypothetical protein [Acidibacillus sp.]